MRTTHVNAQSQRTLSSPAGPDPSGGDGGGNDYDGSLAAPGSADPSAGAAQVKKFHWDWWRIYTNSFINYWFPYF